VELVASIAQDELGLQLDERLGRELVMGQSSASSSSW